jgi:Uma2 family endonuclease
MSNEETLLNFFMFYVLWFGIIYALTAPTRPHRARNWCLCGLIAASYIQYIKYTTNDTY